MPVVIVEMWEGRTLELKRDLVRNITESFVKLDFPREAVQVILNEVPKHNWGKGGKLVSE